MKKALIVSLMCVAVAGVIASACGGGKKNSAATPTPRPIPSPVATPPATESGFTLGDPSLEALPGAKVETGQFGGMLYQIEIPDAWNGRLVMYTHGNDLDTELQVYPPVNREWLIEHGYAWAAASYTVNVAYVSGVAADETAALWDFFVAEHGRPAYSYAMGDSMGGAAAFTAAERYPDRYDGALPLCADSPPSRVEGDFFYAAAFIAGVTQAEYDAGDIGTIIDTRIKPALRDPATRARFDALWSDMSGGERPFVAEGVDIYYATLWTTSIGNVVSGVDGNDGVEYKLGPSAGVSSEDFNRGVIRVKTVPGADKYEDVNRITGEIQIPTLTVQPTGDALTVFSSSQELRRRVEAAGKQDVLMQRAVQSSQHCFDRGLSNRELNEAFQALVDWVEQVKKPEGEDLSGDVSDAGAKFTRSPRLGSAEASAMPTAGQRLALSGTVRVDGQPVDDAFMFAIVEKDGMMRACSYGKVALDDGRYRLTLAPDAETPGCGAAGSTIRLVLFRDTRLLSEQTMPWPAGTQATFDVTFSTAKPSGAAASDEDVFGTGFYGSLRDAHGNDLGPGTKVEAYIGDTLCGTFSVPPVKMVFDETEGSYEITVASPSMIPACAKDATVSFRINGQDTGITGANDQSKEGHRLPLVQK